MNIVRTWKLRPPNLETMRQQDIVLSGTCGTSKSSGRPGFASHLLGGHSNMILKCINSSRSQATFYSLDAGARGAAQASAGDDSTAAAAYDPWHASIGGILTLAAVRFAPLKVETLSNLVHLNKQIPGEAHLDFRPHLRLWSSGSQRDCRSTAR